MQFFALSVDALEAITAFCATLYCVFSAAISRAYLDKIQKYTNKKNSSALVKKIIALGIPSGAMIFLF